MNINLIVAISNNNVIGYKNKLPWHLPKDLAHFKATTLNHNVLMGKNTFMSIIEYLHKPLPQRHNIVISSSLANNLSIKNSFPDVEIFASLQDFYIKYKDEEQKIYIIGGEQIYKQTINLATNLSVSHVDINCEGDAFFPLIDNNLWQITYSENIKDTLPFSIKTYKRNVSTINNIFKSE